MYNTVPPAVDSVRVNSKEKFEILLFSIILVFFSILVSEIAIMSKLVLVVLSKYLRSSKFLDKENERKIIFLITDIHSLNFF